MVFDLVLLRLESLLLSVFFFFVLPWSITVEFDEFTVAIIAKTKIH